MDIPKIRSRWCHKKTGNRYEILTISNGSATREDWPVTVVYADTDGIVWSRPLSEWAERYELQYS